MGKEPEVFHETDGEEELVSLIGLASDPAFAEAVAALRQHEVNFVFIGTVAELHLETRVGRYYGLIAIRIAAEQIEKGVLV